MRLMLGECRASAAVQAHKRLFWLVDAFESWRCICSLTTSNQPVHVQPSMTNMPSGQTGSVWRASTAFTNFVVVPCIVCCIRSSGGGSGGTKPGRLA